VIGHKAEREMLTEKELTVEFDGSVAIVVSVGEEDYIGSEAINYVATDGTIVVI
jgi:hypothetical protein